MFRIKLSEATPTILAFDGEILECFFDEGGSKRIHIMHVMGIQLEAAGNEKHLLTIKLKRDSLLLWVDDEAVAKVNEYVSQIQKAMTFIHP